MKLFKYIWRNVTRNKLRSFLTILSITFSMALMTLLYGYITTSNMRVNEAKLTNRIVVMNKQGFAGLLPISYLDRVRSMENVVAASPQSWFGGRYSTDNVFFAQFGSDPTQWQQVYDEYTIDPAQLEAWKNNRQGCIAEKRLAERMGWKIGESIVLAGTIYPVKLELELVGMYDAGTNTNTIYFDLKYVDELLKASAPGFDGNAGSIYAKIKDAPSMAAVATAIDEKFASSPEPTKTQTESAFRQMFADMAGNVQLYIQVISLAVVFALTLVTANAMAMSTRERTTEIAVLKAIGFTKGRVLTMVLGEAAILGLLGGLVGVGLGCLVTQAGNSMMPLIIQASIVEIAGPWLVALVAGATLIGLLSGLIPAINAASISVVNGLRRV
jgi:putative ABC transport system permease protein